MSSVQLARYAKQIQDWLATCKQDHVVLCNRPGSSILPKRLILFDQNFYRLIEVDVAKGYQYVALSYCWGRKENFKTTPANLHQMELEIPHDQLPQTLKDVFALVRELGYKYVWVDALCIVQDDHSAEWRTEAAKMGDVYANADLVIGASASESVHAGLFVDTTKEYSPDEKTEFHRIMRTCRTMTQKEWHGGIQAKFPLLCRGWAFQERLLARRIVHFTVLELIWECMEDRWCECGDEGKERLSGKVNNMNSALKECRFDPSPAKLRLMWHECVQSFSKRDLTVLHDRLFAIAGIASYLRPNPPDDLYVHGMWKDFLPWDLVWYCDQTSELVMKKSRGPSYSWTSVDCGVEWPACPPPCVVDERFSIAISTGTCFEAHLKEETTPANCFRAVTNITQSLPDMNDSDASMSYEIASPSEASHTLTITSSLEPVIIRCQSEPQSSWWSKLSKLISVASCLPPWKQRKQTMHPSQKTNAVHTMWRVCNSSNGQRLPFWPDVDLGCENKFENTRYYYVELASIHKEEGVREVGLIVRRVSGERAGEEEEMYERVGLAGNMSCGLEKGAQLFNPSRKMRTVVLA